MNPLFKLVFAFALLNGTITRGQNPEISFQLGHHTGVYGAVSDSAFSSLFSADAAGNVVHWDIASGRQVRMFSTPGEPVNDLLLLEKEKKLVTLHQHRVNLWDLTSGRLLHTDTSSRANNLLQVLPFHSGLLVAGHREMYVCDQALRVTRTFRYDAVYEEPGKTPKLSERSLVVSVKEDDTEQHGSGLGGIFLSADGRQVTYAVFSREYNLRYRGLYTLDAETFGLVRHEKHLEAFTMKVSPDKKYIYRLNLLRKRMIMKGAWNSDGSGNPMTSLATYCPASGKTDITAYQASRQYLVFGDRKGAVVVCGASSNRHKFVLNGHQAPISCLGISADEKYLYSADEKGLILLWDLVHGKLVRPLKGTALSIHTILYNENGDKLIIGFGNGEVKLWDLLTNEQKKLSLHSLKVKMTEWSVLKIDDIKADSMVYFRCRGKDEKNTYVYDAVWNVYTNAVMLTELAMNDKEAERVQNDTIVMPDGTMATFAGNDILVPGSHTGSRIPSGHGSAISDITYNARYDFYTTAGHDGVLKSWKKGSNTPLFTSGCIGERGYFHVLPEGHYFADKSSLRYLSFRINDKIYPFEQFDIHFNRPDLVMKKFPFADNVLVESFEKAYEKRRKRTKQITLRGWHPDDAPLITISGNPVSNASGEYTFTVTAKARKAPLRYLHIEVNGVPETITETGTVLAYENRFTVKLNEGLNRITAYAENHDGVLSLKEEITVKNAARKIRPMLYVIAIGSGEFSDSSMNLKYAAKDAKDIFELFGRTRHKERVVKRLYTGPQVNREMLSEIENVLSAATVNDMVVIFYAGHGLLDKKFDYYLSTAATDFHHPETQSILYTDLENIVARCRSRKKLFLLDACHSGELDREAVTAGKSNLKVFVGEVRFRGTQTEIEMGSNKAFELSKALFADVDKSIGAAIISSASGAELAVEGDAWNNGLFTHVVLTGLRSKKADLNGDKHIHVSELLYYVNEKVKTLTKGKQNPNGRAENIYYDFTVR